MRYDGTSKLLILFTLSISGTLGALVHSAQSASETYQVTTFPFYSQEGSTITIVLHVGGAQNPANYSFTFSVRDPTGTVWTSSPQNTTTGRGQTEFGMIISFPSIEFPCSLSTCPSTSFVGTYLVAANQMLPCCRTNPVQTAWFLVGILNQYRPYQRTETVQILATGYSPGESVNVTIRTSGSVLVYSHAAIAAPGGQVYDSWYVPKNAATTDYIVTLAGTVTSKPPSAADAQGFAVQTAFMTISAFSSSKSTYQRTETFSFSFQAVYPSGQKADTGLALITLTRPDRANRTLTATHDGATQAFVASYKTTADNQTGSWSASMASYGFDDSYGNVGPDAILATSPSLQPAALTVSIAMKTVFAASEQIKFNATIRYPDGAQQTSGSVQSTLSQTGGSYTASVPTVFDTSLKLWVGIYSPKGDEPSGLWSLTVAASDGAQPVNSGSSVKAIQIQNRPPVATFTGSSNTALTSVAVTFDGTSSSDPDGTVVSYLWDFGDGSTASGAVASHSYANPGAYTVRLTITDNSGSTASSTYTVSITANPSSNNASFPLYYFGVIAAVIAASLAGAIMALKRHRVTHTKLRIDLEAVRSEAGRIENQEFFQSVKDQLKKDKND